VSIFLINSVDFLEIRGGPSKFNKIGQICKRWILAAGTLTLLSQGSQCSGNEELCGHIPHKAKWGQERRTRVNQATDDATIEDNIRRYQPLPLKFRH
jgi:hypothetical protein